MAASVTRRCILGGKALPAAAAVLGGTAVFAATRSHTAYLEESRERRQERLPIYSAPPEPITLVEVRGPLEEQVASARKAILNSTTSARAFVRGQVDRWIGVEKSVENRVSALIPQDEPLTPNILYVGVATLAGSIFTRYRSLPIRLLTPPVLLVTSMNYLLPKTSHNLAQYYLELEGRLLPEEVRQQRQRLSGSLHDARTKAEGELHKARESGGEMLQKGLKSVEQNTGFKVATATGRGTTAEQIAAGQEPRSRMV